MAYVAIAVGSEMLKFTVGERDLASVQDILMEALGDDGVVPMCFETHDDIGTQWTSLFVSRSTDFYICFHDSGNEYADAGRRQAMKMQLNRSGWIQVNIAGDVLLEDSID